MSEQDNHLDDENKPSCDPVGLLLKVSDEKDIELARLRKSSKYKTIALVLSGGFLALSFSIFSQFPKSQTVQTVDNSVICPIEASKNPRVTDVVISEFSKEAILSVYNFDFLNWREVINNAGNLYFTESGKDNLMKQIAESQTVGTVVQNNLIMRTTSSDVPQIESRDLATGEWVVRVPITTQFFMGGKEPKDTFRFIASVVVVQHPRSHLNYNGIAVKRVSLMPVR